MPRNTLIMIAASLGFFFVTATTFTSLGYVLYTMVAELGWSLAAAGTSFSCLGLACGLSSPLPPLLIKLVGTRFTMFIGALVLAAGFLLASSVHAIGLFFVATSLMGVGFSLIAPSPAVFLIATWFPKTSARMIGFYFMAGALGGVAGPLIVSAIVGLTGSWRMHWLAMSIAAVALGIVMLLTIRDAVAIESAEQVKHAGYDGPAAPKAAPWTVRKAMFSPAFLGIAFALLVVQTVVTTMHSVLVTHIASLGSGAGPGALAMSLLALSGTAAKGATGALSERIAPRGLLVAGLALQFVAIVLMCVTGTATWAVGAALLFGVGWGLAWLSGHILILRYFGAALAADLTAAATMATTFAVLGPFSAGRVADQTGSYVPIFVVFAALLALACLVSALILRAPTRRDDVEDDSTAPGGLAAAPAE